MWKLFHFMLSHRSLRLSSLLKLFFSFFCFVYTSSIALTSRSLILFLLYLGCYWIPLVFFNSAIIFFSFVTFIWYLLSFLSLCWSSLQVHSLFPWDWLASLWPEFWTLYQVDNISISLRLFPFLGFFLFFCFSLHIFIAYETCSDSRCSLKKRFTLASGQRLMEVPIALVYCVIKSKTGFHLWDDVMDSMWLPPPPIHMLKPYP